jgi:hypothetical protein
MRSMRDARNFLLFMAPFLREFHFILITGP